ncbi:retrovirus-related pol polyprotein from transposon TNT 1-94 [Tanacetum coccineum]|uniref:Retrovirus-related pol polyprotein from transposon TNT 1-94 n=1 Tax=Tanacetum coccineum TaxID=301880 RepID=A0ABQ5HPM9_9ASTR
MKGKDVETKFEKSSVIRQPNAFKSQRQSILGKSTIFSDSLANKDFSKSKLVTTQNVSHDFSKPITAQILPQNVLPIFKNTNVIAPGMYKVHTKPNQTRTQRFPQDIRKTNKHVSFSTGVIPTTSVSRPQLKSNQLEDRVMSNNSQGKKQEVEDHRRNFKFSKNKTSVTACNDSLNAKTSNVNFICITYGKCVLNNNHDLCVLHYINGVNSRTRKPMAVPISTREPKHNVNQSVATSSKKTIATDSTVKKSRNITRKLVEIILFIVDSGCSKHMIRNLKLLINFMEKFMGTIKFRNDQIAPILGYGDLVQGTITIKRVYYVEGLNHNLFSVGQFCDADLEVAFRKSTCYIHNLKGNDLLTGSRGTDLYSITLQDSTTPNPICLMAKATSSQAWLWHRRLSHLNFDTINLLSKNNIVNGLPKLKFVKDHLCSSCELGKAKRKSFHTKTTPSSKRRLQLLHMDLCGPMRVESINGKKYVLVIVDDYSRYTWTHFLRSKDETPGVLIDFLTLVQRGLHAQVTTVRTDKGTEFLNKTLHAYFAKEGIRHETSTARTPEQNGVVERRNRTLVEAARTMLSAAKVPLFFWAEAIATTCFTQNRSLVIPRHEKTPYHIINARKPSVKFFHIFGSLCYIVRDGENLDKMKEKGDACIFVGYSTQSKAYRVFNKRTRMIVETIHVNFDELPQMASDHVSSDPVQRTKGRTSSHHVDKSVNNKHTYSLSTPSSHKRLDQKDHPLEQSFGNPSQSVRTRRQLEQIRTYPRLYRIKMSGKIRSILGPLCANNMSYNFKVGSGQNKLMRAKILSFVTNLVFVGQGIMLKRSDRTFDCSDRRSSFAPVDSCSGSCKTSQQSTKSRGMMKLIQLPGIRRGFSKVSEEDSDLKQAQRDKDMQKNLALLAKYFKRLYKPTNNNLRTSSNSRNKTEDTTPRYNNDNQSGQFGNQRTMTVTRTRETIGSQAVQQNGIQCFNCKGFGHYAKECQKPKVEDLKAQMQDKNIAISELKKLIEKCKGKSVETQFDKPSVARCIHVSLSIVIAAWFSCWGQSSGYFVGVSYGCGLFDLGCVLDWILIEDFVSLGCYGASILVPYQLCLIMECHGTGILVYVSDDRKWLCLSWRLNMCNLLGCKSLWAGRHFGINGGLFVPWETGTLRDFGAGHSQKLNDILRIIGNNSCFMGYWRWGGITLCDFVDLIGWGGDVSGGRNVLGIVWG